MDTRYISLPDGSIAEVPAAMSDGEAFAKLGYQAPAAPTGSVGFLGGVQAGISNRFAQLAGGIDQSAISAGNALGLPTGWFQHDQQIADQDAATTQQRVQASGIPQSMGDIRGPMDALKFIGSAALTSVPDIALATSGIGLPFEVAGLEGTTARTRAANDKRAQPTGQDYLEAIPGTVANIALQRFGVGGKGVNFLQRVAREGLAQGGVSATSYISDTSDTLAQPKSDLENLGNIAKAGVQGAVVGAALGAGFHVGERAFGLHKAGQSPDDLPPIPPDAPTNLLQLPDLRSDADKARTDTAMAGAMYATPQGDVVPDLNTAVRTMNEPHDFSQTPPPKSFEDVPIGTQTDMFGLQPHPDAASEPATQRANDAGGQLPTQLPDPLQPSLFDEAPSAVTRVGFGPREVRMALTGGAKPDPFVFKVATALTRSFADGNIEDARGFIDKEYDRLTKADLVPATIDHRTQVLDRANNLVETYHSQHTDALAQEGAAKAAPGADVGPAPVAKDTAVAQAFQQNEQVKAAEPALRKQLLDRALTTDGIRDPAGYYEALLKRNNLDSKISDDEFEHMYRTLETRDAEDAQINEAAAKSGTAELEQHIPPARKGDVAAALNASDQARASADKGITRAEATATAHENRPASEQKVPVTKVAPGDARGLEPRRADHAVPVPDEVQPEPQLTQEQVDQQEVYRRIGDARANNHITDNEQALLTNMIREGAHPDVVKQAVSDLVRKRKLEIRKADIAQKAGTKSPREAAIDKAEATPRRAGLPAQAATPEEAATLPQARRLELTKAHTNTALRRGSMPDALKAIADYHPNPVFRRVAAAIHAAGIDIPVTVEELPKGNWSGVTYISGDHVEIVLDPTKGGANPPTILHEAIHAFLISRLGMFSHAPSEGFLHNLPDPVKDAMMDFIDAHDAMKNIFDNLPPELKNRPWALESLQDLDEFAAYIPTDTNAQQYLAKVGMDGKPLKRGQPSVWDRIVDAVRRALRLAPLPQVKSALEEILGTHFKLIDAAAKLKPDMQHASEQVARADVGAAQKPMQAGREPTPEPDRSVTPEDVARMRERLKQPGYVASPRDIEISLGRQRRDQAEIDANTIKHGPDQTMKDLWQRDVFPPRHAFMSKVDTADLKDEGERHAITTPIKTAQAVKDFTAGKSTRFAAVMSLGPKLAEMAVNAGVRSAATYQRLVSEREARARQHETHLADLADRFDKLKSSVLKGRTKGSINNLAKRSVFEAKWAFQPDWLKDDKGNSITVQVDPAMHAEYMAMPAQARKIYEDGFRIPHELLHAQRKAVNDFIEGEHQRMIDAAVARHDAAVAQGAGKDALNRLAGEVRNARKSRDEDFKKFGRLFNLRLDEPYMPIRRFGDYVVVGRSKDFLAEELKARETGDSDKLDAMKSDANHYFVDFAQTTQEGERMRRELKQVLPQFNHDNGVEKFSKDDAQEQLLGGRDMFHAFERLRKLINDTTTVGSKERGKLDKMVTDMLLSTLVASSSRKAEMARLKVAGGNLDMMRAAISHGRGVASFIAGIHKNSEILDSLGKMRDEAQFQGGERDATGREKRQSLVNEMMARHVMSMAPPPQSEWANRMLSVSSLWNLLMSPSFYVQQAFQPFSMSVPVSGAKHGYAAAMRELGVGYRRVGDAWKGTGLTTPLKLEQLPPEYRSLATFLSERGRLDIGISKALGDWSSDGQGMLNDAMHNTIQNLGAVTRKSEAVNRLATALMEYNLSTRGDKPVEKIYDEGAYASYIKDMREAHPDMDPMTERQFAAANHALKLIDDTHGTYDIASSPRWMRGNLARVLTQFKKFQIMQVQLYAQNLHDAFFAGDKLAPEQKLVARRTLAFLVGHAAVLTGAFGLPAFGALQVLWQSLMGIGTDKPDNMEEDIRKAVGNPEIADLLIHGVPSLADVNLTSSMGQGNILSPAPYTNFDLGSQPRDATDKYAEFVMKLGGPFVGGVGLNMWRAANFMNNGDYYRGLETSMPRGITGMMRAAREYNQGETTLSGNKTADVSAHEAILAALGLTPIDRTRRQFVKDVFYGENDAFSNRALELRQQFADAETSAEKAQVRQKWQNLQADRQAEGFRRQPFSSLLRTEQNLRRRMYGEGITYNRKTRKAANEVQSLVEDGEE